jgi:hypothetical protein
MGHECPSIETVAPIGAESRAEVLATKWNLHQSCNAALSFFSFNNLKVNSREDIGSASGSFILFGKFNFHKTSVLWTRKARR